MQVTDLQSRPVDCQSKSTCTPALCRNPRFWEPVRATTKLSQPHENLTTAGRTQNLSSTYSQWTFTECLWCAIGNGNPLQYYCLENPMDRGVWWITIRGVTKSRTQLSKWVMCHKYYSDWCEVKHKQNMGSGSSSVQSLSCPTLWDPMDCSTPPCPWPTPGAYPNLMSIESVMPSNHLILCRPSPPFNLSQHQGLFQWVSSSHQVAKVWEFQLQHQSFQWIFRTDFL